MLEATVLHLSTSDVDNGGARAAYRLHQGLQQIGVNSRILVRAKFSHDRTVIPEKSLLTKLGPPMSGLPVQLFAQHTTGMFSSQWFPDAILPKVEQLNPDIIHLHWTCNGFLRIETLSKFKKPIVWTLHDMWPFTGGCHYADSCTRYTNACGACPQLKSNRNWDLSRWVWWRKASAWKNLNLTIVSPSEWLANCAKTSTLFKDLRIEVVPHGLDLEKYKSINRQLAREVFNLPQDKKLVLFGASPGTTGNFRKGFHLLQTALQSLSKKGWQDKLELVIFGASQPENPIDVGVKVHYLDSFQDDTSLALLYSAGDVLVVPSMQEAFGQVASESLACGTPVVAFTATGLKDIVEHQQNGYLAKPFEADSLAKGIAWVIEDDSRYKRLRICAREKAEQKFKLELQAHRYLSIYKSLGTARDNDNG
jgi:glycosyltransferase involved in cell wall biosynthesis